MAWCVELNPIRAVMSTRPTICNGQSKQQVPTRFDEATEGRESADRILHVLETVMGHHKAIATTMVLHRHSFKTRDYALLQTLLEPNVDPGQPLEALRVESTQQST